MVQIFFFKRHKSQIYSRLSLTKRTRKKLKPSIFLLCIFWLIGVDIGKILLQFVFGHNCD